jgi:pyruvate dehydrogenase (quinone)
MADLINHAETVAVFGGFGCGEAQSEVRQLAQLLKAPVGYSLKGKQFLEHDNPNAVGMTGLLGYGGCHRAVNHADVLLLLGTDFPFTNFMPDRKVTAIQVDIDPSRLGRRTPVDLAVAGDIRATLDALMPLLGDKTDDHFLGTCLKEIAGAGASSVTSPQDRVRSRSDPSTSPRPSATSPVPTRSSSRTPALR